MLLHGTPTSVTYTSLCTTRTLNPHGPLHPPEHRIHPAISLHDESPTTNYSQDNSKASWAEDTSTKQLQQIHTNIPMLSRCASLRILSFGFFATHRNFYWIWAPNQKCICLCKYIFLHVYPCSFIYSVYRQHLISLGNLKQWDLIENYEYIPQPKLVTCIH
jgi:hypothetical protein